MIPIWVVRFVIFGITVFAAYYADYANPCSVSGLPWGWECEADVVGYTTECEIIYGLGNCG